jgi:hypothetical protein
MPSTDGQMEVTYFSPGQVSQPGPPLAAYGPITITKVLGPYLDAYTRPGDLVIDLFCRDPATLYEIARYGRRALGLNVNQAILLAASIGLTAVDRHAVEAAFTQLAESKTGTATLQAHIEKMYRTACAYCGAVTIAEAFIWDRERDAPSEKRYHCSACSADSQALIEAPVNEADLAAAKRFESRGLTYWLLLDRAAPGNAPHRDRIASLLELYTPRNLAAINGLLLKSDGLSLAPPVRDAIDALLLDTLDQASSLRSVEAQTSRPRRLQRPARYVEANVWLLMERALRTWCELPIRPMSRTSDLDALLNWDEQGEPPVHIAPMSTGQASREMSPEEAALIVVDPPRPDTVLWHLSTLWCHWLWGAEAGAPLNHLLDRRWLDKNWLWRGLRGAFRAIAPLLRPDGRLVCAFADENPAILEALALAASGAGYELMGWGIRPSGNTRLVWRFGMPTTEPLRKLHPESPAVPSETDALSRVVAEKTAQASLDTIRAHGEPLTWRTLHAAIYAQLARSGALARAAEDSDDVPDLLSWLSETIRSALDGAPLHQISAPTEETTGRAGSPMWWLTSSPDPQSVAPLSDRVELAVAEILRDLLAVTDAELDRRVCERFPGSETPDVRLIQLCLFSYGDEHAPGHWRLRAEDHKEVRVRETDAVIADLAALGQRLGFEAALGIVSAGEWAVRWVDETGHAHYVFAVRTTAVLGDLLFHSPLLQSGTELRQPSDARPPTVPCLTLPGGRAALVSHKLRNDPRLQQQIARQGWQFLKFRHLRHLVKEVAAQQLDRYAFQAALGLDPIVEQQDEAQLSLW